MKEVFLHYVWQQQLFDKSDLKTEDNQPVTIIQPGFLNHEAGPDFLQAQLKIGEMVWFGAVEIHVSAKDWEHHRHHFDAAYDQVILHVVWDYNADARRKDNSVIPTLSLSQRVAHDLLLNFQNLHTAGQDKLSCAKSLHNVDEIYKLSALEQAASQRLSRKSNEVLDIYRGHQNDWAQTAFQVLCAAYGFKTNAKAFSRLGQIVPYKNLLKQRHSLDATIALLVHASGLAYSDKLHKRLIDEIRHTGHKYASITQQMEGHEFKLFPVRPPNAPLMRILQLAALIFLNGDLYQLLYQTQELDFFYQLIDEANQYLKKRNPTRGKVYAMSKASMQHLIINAIVPFQMALSKYTGQPKLEENAISLLEKLPAEKNRYTKLLSEHGFPLQTALDSQGALDLQKFRCLQNQCLNCPVGSYIMKNHKLVVI